MSAARRAGATTFTRLALAATAGVLALGLAEVLAWLIGLEPGFVRFSTADTPTRVVDGVLLWDHAQPRADAMDIQRAADPMPFTIVGLGDSIMYGVTLPKDATYLEQARRALALRNQPITVLNLAVPGYNTAQENAAYGEVAGRIRPDLVVLHYWEDDARQYGVIAGHVVDTDDITVDQGRVVVRALPLPPSLSDFLLVHSRLYGLLTRAVASRHGATAADPQRVLAPLAAIDERVRRSGARLVILASPELNPSGIAPNNDLPMLRQFAAAHGDEVIDLAEWLPAVDSKQIALDGCHFNAEGHRLIGQGLATYLLGHDLRAVPAAGAATAQ